MTLTFNEYVNNAFNATVYVTKGVANNTERLTTTGRLEGVQKITYTSKTTGNVVTCVEGTDFVIANANLASITWKGANQPPEGTMYTAIIDYTTKYDFVGDELTKQFNDLFIIKYRYASARLIGEKARLIHNKVEITSINGEIFPNIRNILTIALTNRAYSFDEPFWVQKIDSPLKKGETMMIYDNFSYNKEKNIDSDLQGQLTMTWTNADVTETDAQLLNTVKTVNQFPKVPTLVNQPTDGHLYLFTSKDIGTAKFSQSGSIGVNKGYYSFIPTVKAMISDKKLQYHIPAIDSSDKLFFPASDKDIVYAGSDIINDWNSQYNWADAGSVTTDIAVLYDNIQIGSIRTNITSIDRVFPPKVLPLPVSFNVGESLVITNPEYGEYQRLRSILDYNFVFSSSTVKTSITYTTVRFSTNNIATFTFTDAQVKQMYDNMATITKFTDGLMFNVLYITNSQGQKIEFYREIVYTGSRVTGNITDAQPTMVSNSFELQNLDATVIALGLPAWTTLQGYFRANLMVNEATPKKGANISRYTITLYNQSDGTPVVSGGKVISKNFDLTAVTSAKVDAIINATDSRGAVATVSNSVTVIPYSKPLVIAKASRLNQIETETVLSISGNFSPVSVATGSKSVDKNAITSLKYRTKEEGKVWSNYTDIPYTTVDGTLVVSDITIELDASKKFNIEVTTTDKLNNSSTSSIIVDRATPVFFIDADKNSIGMNRLPASNSAMEIDYQIITKELLVKSDIDNAEVTFGWLLEQDIQSPAPTNVQVGDMIKIGTQAGQWNDGVTASNIEPRYKGRSFEVLQIKDVNVSTSKKTYLLGIPKSKATDAYRGFEFRTAPTPECAYLDIHTSDGGNNDYDIRFYAYGADKLDTGKGNLLMTGASFTFNGTVAEQGVEFVSGASSRIVGDTWRAWSATDNLFLCPKSNGAVHVKANNAGGAYRPIAAASFNVNSDVNSKSNLQLLEDSSIVPNALEMVEDTDVFVYTLKDEYTEGDDITPKNARVGFISQLVPDILEKGKGVDLYGSVGFVYQAVKELSKLSKKTAKKVKKLEAKNKVLEKEIADLKQINKEFEKRLKKLEERG